MKNGVHPGHCLIFFICCPLSLFIFPFQCNLNSYIKWHFNLNWSLNLDVLNFRFNLDQEAVLENVLYTRAYTRYFISIRVPNCIKYLILRNVTLKYAKYINIRIPCLNIRTQNWVFTVFFLLSLPKNSVITGFQLFSS